MKAYWNIGIRLLAIVPLFALGACSNDDDSENLPLVVETGFLKNVSYEEAQCGGEVVSGAAQSRGVCWSTAEMPTLSDNHTTDGGGSGEFTSQLTGLNEGTRYYVRAYATNKAGDVVYGEQKQCTTMAHGRPVIAIARVEQIQEASAVVVPQLLVDGGMTVGTCGIIYSTESEPAAGNGTTVEYAVSKNPVSVSLSQLQDNTTYYVKAYATYDQGTVYSEVTAFTTKRYADPVLSLSTGEISGDEIEVTVKATAGTPLPILEYGVVYAETASPSLEKGLVCKAGEGDGELTVMLKDLAEETLYHIRPYAINKNGTTYGDEIVVSTLSNKAVVRTKATERITAHRAYIGGEIIDLGLKNADILEAGICWSTTANPTVSDSKATSTAKELGEFEAVELFCLAPSTTYHVRAYATNSYGTAYGEDITITTREPVANYWAWKDIDGSSIEFNGFYMSETIPEEQSDDQKEAYALLQNVLMTYKRTLKYYRYYIYPDADGKPGYLRTVVYYSNSSGSNYSGFWDTKLDISNTYVCTCSHPTITGGNATNIVNNATTNGLLDDLNRNVEYVIQGDFVFDWDSELSTTSGDTALFCIIPLDSPEKYKRMKSFRLTGASPLTPWW